MGEIYLITNKLNGKKYVGQTNYTTGVRWCGHFKGRADPYKHNSKLYLAMNKHGIENFTVECLEECENEKLDEREIYYIRHYNSFENGYNATLGGSAGRKTILNKDKILLLWKKGYNLTHISQEEGISRTTVRDFLFVMGVSEAELYSRGAQKIGSQARAVCQINFYTREILGTYPSIAQAARALDFPNSSSIRSVLTDAKLSAYGYFWRYYDQLSDEEKMSNLYNGPFAQNLKDMKIIQVNKDTGQRVECYYSAADADEYMSGYRRSKNTNRAANKGHASYGYRWKWCNITDCDQCPY